MKQRHQLYKLSKSQENIFLSQFSSLSPRTARESNIMGFYYYIHENADLYALEQCYNELLRRHDSLRLVFVHTFKGIRQYFREFEYEKLETLHVSGKDGLREHLACIKDTLPVYLFGGKCIKAQLVDCGGGAGALIVRCHHMLTDGHSNSIIFSELPSLYAAYSAGLTPEHTEYPSVRTLWEYESSYLKSDQFLIDKRYWKNIYTHQRNYRFPAGHRAVNETSSALYFSVSGELHSKFLELLKNTGVTAQQQMMTVVAITVYAITGCDNFAITALTSNRITPEMKRTVGCGFNASPYFYNLDHNLPVQQLISGNYVLYREMLTHCRFPTSAQIPFGWKYGVLRGMNFAHLWITYSGMRQYNIFEDQKRDISLINRTSSSSQFYLAFFDVPGKRFDMRLNYQIYRFSKEQAEKIKQAFFKCLELVLVHPDWNIDQIKADFPNSPSR